MSAKVYENGAWRDINSAKVYENGAWRDANSMKVCENGAWREVYPALPTLTGDSEFLTFKNKVIRNDVITVLTPTGSTSSDYIEVYSTGDTWDCYNTGILFDNQLDGYKYSCLIIYADVVTAEDVFLPSEITLYSDFTDSGGGTRSTAENRTYDTDETELYVKYGYLSSYQKAYITNTNGACKMRVYAIIATNLTPSSNGIPWDGVTGL